MRLLKLSVLVGVLLVAMVAPAFANGYESGYKDCGSYVAYTHARFEDTGSILAPGLSSSTWYFLDGWNIREKNGNYAGNWNAWGSPNLDTNATWAACRSFG